MKIITKAAMILLLAFGVQGCATYARISGVPTDGQKTVFKDGRQSIISIKQATVAVAPYAKTVQNGQRSDFVIAVNNGTPQDVLFSTEDVIAYANTKGQLTALKVFSYEELVAEEQKRQAWSAFGVALQGAASSINAVNAGYSHTYGTYHGSAYSSYGASAYGYGSYSSTTYNYAAAQAAQSAAQASTEARLARLNEEGHEYLRNLSETILKKETIFPGAWHGGVVKVQLPQLAGEPQEVKFMVKVGGEYHVFQFILEKAEDK